FPYTTLFRSGPLAALRQALADHEGVAGAVPDRQERVLLHEAAVGGAHAAEHDAVAHLQPVVGGTGHAVGGHDVIPAAVAPGPVGAAHALVIGDRHELAAQVGAVGRSEEHT